MGACQAVSRDQFDPNGTESRKTSSSSTKTVLDEMTTSSEDIRKVYRFDNKIIGHGHFGTVRNAYLITDPSTAFAVKTIQKEKIKKELHLVKRELEILKSLSHPNIVKFYETYQDERFFHLVMENCNGGELLDRIIFKGQFVEAEAVKMMKKIFSAVSYLHEQGICHRDLKPENFLFSDRSEDAEIKIIDFGLSKRFGAEDGLKSVVGTALYVAPEVLGGKYTQTCDIWSLGIILYILLSGTPPFYAENNVEMFRLILQGNYTFDKPEWKNVSKEAQDLISKLLVAEPSKRLTAHQALKHSWFNSTKKGSILLSPSLVDHTVVNNLKNYSISKKFKREALKIIIRLLSENEVKNLKDAFRIIDTGNTGTISVDELQQAMKDLGFTDTRNEINKIVEELDYEGRSQIKYMDFIAATIDQKKFLTKEKLWTAFKHFDTDDSNFITHENLRDAMARCGRKISMESLEDMMNEFDTKNEGKIYFEQFSEMMMGGKASEVLGPGGISP